MADILSPTGIEKPLGAELHSRAMVNRNYDRTNQIGIDLDLVEATFAKGQVFIARREADSASSTDLIIDFIQPFTFKAGRNYEIIWDFSYRISDTSTVVFFSINSSPITEANLGMVGIAQLGGRAKEVSIANSNTHTGSVTYKFSPVADTPWVIKFRMVRIAGAGTSVVFGSAVEPSTYTINDLGDQA